MKKVIVLAVVVAVTLTGCSMNEVEIESGEIQFRANAISTKALINPVGTKDSTNFPTSETFGVVAYYTNESSEVTTFMDKVKITNQNGDWKAESTDPYIWPAKGTIDFYAYHPYNVAIGVNIDKRISFTGINLGNEIGKQSDPLVAMAKDQVAANRPKVGLVFKHIASQIVISAIDVTESNVLKGNITLKEVNVNNVKISGDYVDGTTLGKGTWSNQANPTTFTVFSGSEQLNSTESYLSANSFSSSLDGSAAFVVVPQTIITGTQTITVKYDVKEFSCNGTVYPAQENKTDTVNISVNDDSGFLCGKRYIYHLGFSLDGVNKEITFSPVVEGWTNEDINNIVFDCSPED